MHVSLSEVEAAVAKAVMGVGLPPGLGEDAGRAARLMLRSGLGTLSELADALDAVGAGASVGFDLERVPAGRLVPVDGTKRLSALQAGPTACDLLLAAAAGGADRRHRDTVTPAATDTARLRDVRGPGSGSVVTLAAVDYPTVVLHEVIDVSRGADIAFPVTWSIDGEPRVEVLCRHGAASPGSGAPAAAFGAGPAEMSIGMVEAISDREVGTRGDAGFLGEDGGGAEVEESAWRRLSAHAARHLVAGSERSRLAGAGAGVVDVD